MEAKDRKRLKVKRTIGYGLYSDRELKQYLEAQAEISFKAGIREVVGWINKNAHLYLRNDDRFIKALEAKLKEWGIKEDK